MLPVDIDALCARAEAAVPQSGPARPGRLAALRLGPIATARKPWWQEHSRRIHCAEPRLAPARHNRDGLARPRAVHGRERH